jgi:hypothetical protein
MVFATSASTEELSGHATRRLRQRGISASVVQLISDFHDRDIPVGDGCRALSVSIAASSELRADGIAPSLLENAVGVILIKNDRQRLVTALHAHGSAHKRYLHRR